VSARLRAAIGSPWGGPFLAQGRPKARRLIAAFGALLLATSAWSQDADAGRAKAAVCMACHGPDGNSSVPLNPILAGQTARYLFVELRDFKEGRRENAVMRSLVATLSREDMLDLAAFFAAQRPTATGFKVDPAKAARGQGKATETLCSMCHLGGLKGQNEIPRVAGQHHDYVVKQLQDFQAGRRTNDAGTMSSVSKTLGDQDIDDLANYLETLD
jgi:cytochrome c553